MGSWTIKEWGILFSILLASASLLITIYKDFIKGAKLETVLNNLVLIRLEEENKSNIIFQILLDDLLSGRPSDQAQTLLNAKKEIADAVKLRNRELTKNALLNYSFELTHTGADKIVYDANIESVPKYFGDKSFALNIYVPLNIVNTGRKTGDITTLILKITSSSDKSLHWIYTCFTEIRADEFINLNHKKPIRDIIGKLFPGINIGPSSNHRLDAFLTPLDSANNRIISKSSLSPGKYNAQIIGYNSRNKKCLESNISILNLDPKALIDSFNGSSIIINLTMEDHVSKEL